MQMADAAEIHSRIVTFETPDQERLKALLDDIGALAARHDVSFVLGEEENSPRFNPELCMPVADTETGQRSLIVLPLHFSRLASIQHGRSNVGAQLGRAIYARRGLINSDQARAFSSELNLDGTRRRYLRADRLRALSDCIENRVIGPTISMGDKTERFLRVFCDALESLEPLTAPESASHPDS